MSLKIDGITKLYGKQKALDGVSLEIAKGEIVGFLGPNGAGKSTLMKIVTGFLSRNEGKVWVCGWDLDVSPLECKRRIGYLPEHNPLYLDLYVREYLRFIAEVYQVSKASQRIDELIELTGLTQEYKKKIGALSKGYRQRVGLAQALLPNPEVLILDEPTTGLDPNQIVEVRELIASIAQDKTIMLSTHIMQEVEAICERVVIINQGKIVHDAPKVSGTVEQLFYDNTRTVISGSIPNRMGTPPYPSPRLT